MRTNLTLDDIDGLLDEPLVAVLATLRPDGSVLLSPVWHEWRDRGFNLWLPADDVKTRHLRRDPRATIVVAESTDPLRGVELRTEARLTAADDLIGAIRIATRYVGPEKGAEYVEGASYDSVIARLEPGKLRVWDFADED
jgi:PPOX class probable F420-dependent enzyme